MHFCLMSLGPELAKSRSVDQAWLEIEEVLGGEWLWSAQGRTKSPTSRPIPDLQPTGPKPDAPNGSIGG